MRLSDFDYGLPDELIAQHPAPERDGSRLMVLDRAGRTISHRQFREVGAFLRPGDCLVVNETRVFPARLRGHREETGGAVEMLLVRPDGDAWEVMARPGRRLREGVVVTFDEGRLRATVAGVLDDGRRRVRFDGDLDAAIERVGEVPLPPYIRREETDEDRERYQTVFAKQDGAVAAPTAGLHFTPDLLDGLKAKGVTVAPVLLHVGPGTFKPVETDDPRDHVLDAEYFEVSDETASAVNAARASGARVVAVGTTSVRTLETAAGADGLEATSGWTRTFIYPPYDFKLVDALITNFHLPRSSLLMLVAALAGHDFMMKAYGEAVREKYRFYSYGDAMLIT